MKKILMIAPTPFFSDRGCHIRILNSYLKLTKEGHKVTIITYPIGRNILNIKPIRTIMLPGYRKTSPGFSIYKPFLDVLLYFKAKGEMDKGYDLIYSHLHEGALIGYFLKKKFHKKVIFDAQGSLTGELSSQGTIKKAGLMHKFIWKIEKFIVENSDEIITSTDDLKYFMIKNFRVKKIKVEIDLPDRSLFNQKVKPAKINLPKGKEIVVYLGGLQLYKGIEYLIRTIPLVDERFHFLIMGYPIEDAKKLAEEIGVQNRITFTGVIPYEKAASYLKLGDLAISPKTLESGEANAKIYNYLAVGLNVVCFDSPENKKILGNKGIYVKEKDIKDLANKINEMIK